MSTKQRFPYFKFYPRDWLEATRDLTLEQRGAYIDLICIIMEMEGHLADNDKWIAHQMHVTARKWRSLKTDLVAHEKITINDGQIVNERCVKELDALLNQRRNIAESAVKRERTKRETPAKHPGNIREISQKPNKNNETSTTAVPLRARVTDSDLDKEKKENTQHARSESVAASGGQPSEITGLNGATALMVSTLARWMSPVTPREREAREWLGNTVQIFGSDVVKAAFADMQSKYAQGDIISRPMVLMTNICRRMESTAQSQKSTGGAKPRPPGVPDDVWEGMQQRKREREAQRDREFRAC